MKAKHISLIFLVLALLPLLIAALKAQPRSQFVATAHMIYQTSGPFPWSYFEWDLIGDNATVSVATINMSESERFLLKLVNPLHISLFHLSVYLACVAFYFKHKSNSEDQEDGGPQMHL